uniref:Uncharacterized protein n=1 Tax=Callorhinchus milii TaxID=7868 RepID=A0A4W3H2R7_CALMI
MNLDMLLAEVVRCLLDAGAKVNDSDDSMCEGITPLHDALNNRRLSVVELLIARGASANLRDKEGSTPQDIINNLCQMSDLDMKTQDRLVNIKRRLQTTSLAAVNGDENFGQVVNPEPSPSLAVTGSKVWNLPELPLGKRASEAELSPPLTEDWLDNSPSKRRRQVTFSSWDADSLEDEILPMFHLTMSSQGSQVTEQNSQPEAGEGTGHWAESQAGVVVDSSMIYSCESDEGSTTDVLQETRDSSSTEISSPSPPFRSHPPPPGNPAPLTDPGDWAGGQADPKAVEKGYHWSDSGLAGDWPCAGQGQDREMAVREGVSKQCTGTHLTPHSSQGAAQPMVSVVGVPLGIRIRVRVRDITFLIGVPHSRTHDVGWLAEQASNRYQQTCGFLPRVTLTSSGARLHPQDLVLHVLRDNEEVLAEVTAWDLPPLSDRYTRCCQLMRLDRVPALAKVLKLQETSPSLDLSDLDLGREQSPPLLRALQRQSETRELRLSSNRLCDRLLEELGSTLATLPGLSHLDLASNRISAPGLMALCDATLGPSDLSLQSLEKLDLSMNALGDACSPSIARLLTTCPRLNTLRLQSCQLTSTFLQCDSLREAIRGSSELKRLCLSHNMLGLNGVKLLTQTLPQHISHLDIASVVGSLSHKAFISHIATYLLQDACALTHLNLSENSLTDDDIQDFASSLMSYPLLVSLDLSGNLGITDTGQELLLSALSSRDSRMDSLILAGCSIKN